MILSNNINNQKGEFLLEALIGMVIFSVISIGNLMVLNTVTQSSAEAKQYSYVINQLKNTLQTQEKEALCNELFEVYIPKKQENQIIVSENCIEKTVVLKHFEAGEDGFSNIDLAGTAIETYSDSIRLTVDDYAVN